MPRKEIVFFGQRAVIACDGKCNKAWGINGRSKIRLSKDVDDYVYVGDDDLGIAPLPHSSEGDYMRPSNATLGAADGSKMNKWCARECERRVMTSPGQPEAQLVLPDMKTPKPNIHGRDLSKLGHLFKDTTRTV